MRRGCHDTFCLENSQFFWIVPAVKVRVDIDELFEFPKVHKADDKQKKKSAMAPRKYSQGKELVQLLLHTHACGESRSDSAKHQMNPGTRATVAQLEDY